MTPDDPPPPTPTTAAISGNTIGDHNQIALLTGSGQVIQIAGNQANAQTGGVAIGGDIHGSLTIIQLAADHTTRLPQPALNPDCPYPGLDTFTEAQGRDGLFFGREALATRVRDDLAAAPLILLTGASGSGKSSFLRAALLPLTDPARWLTLLITPLGPIDPSARS